jgi:4-hydroxybenzoate polyprenyltransferase
MFFARTWAMLVNRLADWRYDAANPRTSRRAVASGRLSARDGWLVAIGCAIGFALACAGFWWLEGNPWPLFLCVPVLAWIAFYSFTKRFTMLAHLFLGGALAASPIASAIAAQPRLVFGALGLMEPSTGASPGAGAALFLLAGFVLLWVAGFDVAYALQDLDFDRRTGLHSIPSKLGARGALWSARALHAGALAMLVLAARCDARFGGIMLSAAALAGAILVFEHVVLARRGVAGLPLAFFTLNGCVSLLMGAAGVADVLM